MYRYICIDIFRYIDILPRSQIREVGGIGPLVTLVTLGSQREREMAAGRWSSAVIRATCQLSSVPAVVRASCRPCRPARREPCQLSCAHRAVHLATAPRRALRGRRAVAALVLRSESEGHARRARGAPCCRVAHPRGACERNAPAVRAASRLQLASEQSRGSAGSGAAVRVAVTHGHACNAAVAVAAARGDYGPTSWTGAKFDSG
jgi:hypothetical protein